MSPASTSSDHPTAPAFPILVALHLRLLWREFPIGWAVLGGLSILFPLVAALHVTSTFDPADPPRGLFTVAWLVLPLNIMTIAVAFLWPDGVWRALPPGGRLALDALPVSRRAHRMARVTAGFALPLVMAASVVLTAALLAPHPALGAVVAWVGGEAGGPAGILAGVFSLMAAYLLASALALRLGRVLLPLALLFGGAVVLLLLVGGMGWVAGEVALQRWLLVGHWAPARSLFLAGSADAADLAPALLWCFAFLGLCTWWAGRHDRA